MPAIKDVKSFGLDAREAVLPELESAELGSLEFEFQEVEPLGYKSPGFGSVGLESVGFESVEIESVELESLEIESVEIKSVEIDSVEIESVEIVSMDIESREDGPAELGLPDIEHQRTGRVTHDARGNAVWKWSGDTFEACSTERRPGVLEDFDLNDLEIEDHAGQVPTFGGGYDPYNQTRSMSHPVGKKGGGTRR